MECGKGTYCISDHAYGLANDEIVKDRSNAVACEEELDLAYTSKIVEYVVFAGVWTGGGGTKGSRLVIGLARDKGHNGSEIPVHDVWT